MLSMTSVASTNSVLVSSFNQTPQPLLILFSSSLVLLFGSFKIGFFTLYAQHLVLGSTACQNCLLQ